MNEFNYLASQVNSFVQFITLLIVFVIVLFLTYATTRFVGGYQKTMTENSNIKPIDTYRVSNNKYIQIIQVGSKYLVISVCKDSITTLAELSEEDICKPKYSENDTFAKMFEKLKKNMANANYNEEQKKDEQDK